MFARIQNQIHKDLGESSGIRMDAVALALNDRFEPLPSLSNNGNQG